jgi:hypothetical protein
MLWSEWCSNFGGGREDSEICKGVELLSGWWWEMRIWYEE